MALDSFPNVPLRFLDVPSRCDASRQIGNVSGPIIPSLLENHGVFLAHGFVSKPAAFRIDFSVPIGTSSPGRPGIVTTFGFEACL
jgi:hypothetical protein